MTLIGHPTKTIHHAIPIRFDTNPVRAQVLTFFAPPDLLSVAGSPNPFSELENTT